MAFIPFKKVQLKDESVMRMQDSVSASFNALSKNFILDSVLVENVQLTNGVDNTVSHTLGRNFKGWLVVRNNAESVIYESSTANDVPNRQIILNCSADVLVSLFIF